MGRREIWLHHLPEEIKKTGKTKIHFYGFHCWYGIAATLILSTLTYHFSLSNDLADDFPLVTISDQVPTLQVEDPESPIHGVSVAELEERSGMPVGGWTPIFNKKLLDRIDEGVVSRPSGLPARQVRMRYLDEIWQHPAMELASFPLNPTGNNPDRFGFVLTS